MFINPQSLLCRKYWILYLKYFVCILVHKYYVGYFCIKRNLFLPAITHDLNKFHPSEFFIRAIMHDCFVNNIAPLEWQQQLMARALRHHYVNCKHHWQYWHIFYGANYDIPQLILKEMVCDWQGVCTQYKTKKNYVEWYWENKDNVYISDLSKKYIETLLV